MEFSAQQQSAISAVAKWLKVKGKEAQIFRLFGFAGTGKTTLAKHLAEGQKQRVAFAAFTGKAAKVLRDKGCEGASTIHSLIYSAEQDPETGLFTYKLSDRKLQDVGLVIIDECSMVGEALAKDLLSFGKKVLVLGDPGQLPPVKDGGFFTEVTPDFMLDEIHRQAAESPILRLATDIRQGRMPTRPFEDGGLQVLTRADMDSTIVLGADAVLIGRNVTRFNYNRRLRELRGFEGGAPQEGETLICLRNDHNLGLLNGGTWRVHKQKKAAHKPDGRLLKMELEDQDQAGLFVPVSVWEHFFAGPDAVRNLPWQSKRGTQEFDYGYAITVHKSQGSQWPSVCLFDESGVFGPDRHRWLYTGATRAAERLTLVL